jgi:hypothetical protein
MTSSPRAPSPPLFATKRYAKQITAHFYSNFSGIALRHTTVITSLHLSRCRNICVRFSAGRRGFACPSCCGESRRSLATTIRQRLMQLPVQFVLLPIAPLRLPHPMRPSHTLPRLSCYKKKMSSLNRGSTPLNWSFAVLLPLRDFPFIQLRYELL